MNLVKLMNALMPRCMEECEAKTILRTQFEHFEEEQKIETAHHVCHQIGYYDLLVKILFLVLIAQMIYYALFFRMY